jgi:hypothetical protein
MQMYPAYKLQDVLNEYAITFFALLNQGYRLRYKNYLMLASIGDLPAAEKAHRDQFYQQLEWAATDPSDILSSSGKGSTDAEIKKALGG